MTFARFRRPTPTRRFSPILRSSAFRAECAAALPRSAAVLLLAAVIQLVSGCGTAGQNANGTGNTANSNGAGQDSSASARRRLFPLHTLKTSTVTINGKTLRVWLALNDAQRAEGLMFVPENEIADDQGMLFVFPDSEERSFWMRNTITSLDIAFIASDGRIVKTHTMPPLTDDSFPSGRPAQFALEVKAGTFARLGIKEGDVVAIPPDISKSSR